MFRRLEDSKEASENRETAQMTCVAITLVVLPLIAWLLTILRSWQETELNHASSSCWWARRHKKLHLLSIVEIAQLLLALPKIPSRSRPKKQNCNLYAGADTQRYRVWAEHLWIGCRTHYSCLLWSCAIRARIRQVGKKSQQEANQRQKDTQQDILNQSSAGRTIEKAHLTLLWRVSGTPCTRHHLLTLEIPSTTACDCPRDALFSAFCGVMIQSDLHGDMER